MLLATNSQIASARDWTDIRWNQPSFQSLGGDIMIHNNKPHLPVVIKNRINALEAFVMWSDGSIRHIWQNKPNSGWNTNWASLSGDFSGGFSVARNQDGRVEVFAVGNDGIIRHRWQESNGVWKVPWQPIDGVTFGSADPAVILNWHNELEIFAVGRDGNVYDAWQNGPGGAFLPWRSLGPCTPPGCDTIVAATNDDGRAEIFTVGNDNQIRHRWQESNGVWKVPWQTFPHITTRPSTPRVVMNEDGRLEVFVHAGGSIIQHIWQVEPNGRWLNYWEDRSLGSVYTYNEPSVTSYDDGRLALFGWDNYTNFDPTSSHSYARIDYNVQTEPNKTFFGFLGHLDIPTTYSRPTAVSNDDGRLEIFVVDVKSHQLLHRWQVPV